MQEGTQNNYNEIKKMYSIYIIYKLETNFSNKVF